MISLFKSMCAATFLWFCGETSDAALHALFQCLLFNLFLIPQKKREEPKAGGFPPAFSIAPNIIVSAGNVTGGTAFSNGPYL